MLQGEREKMIHTDLVGELGSLRFFNKVFLIISLFFFFSSLSVIFDQALLY